MEEEHDTDNQSPSPVCADRRIAEPQGAEPNAPALAAATNTEHTAEEVFGAIEPTAELGPRAAEVRAQVAAALQRALERAEQATKPKQ
jgi:hypothetical protein